jgi:hypothetical protein
MGFARPPAQITSAVARPWAAQYFVLHRGVEELPRHLRVRRSPPRRVISNTFKTPFEERTSRSSVLVEVVLCPLPGVDS